MGNAQRLSDEQHEHSRAAQRPSLDVPADWFVDPADPQAADRLEHGRSLDDQATSFLAAHEESEKHPEITPQYEDDVEPPVALSEAPSRRTEPEVQPVRNEAWLGLPSLIPAEQIEGELAWQVDALCAQTDPEAFFPEKGGSTRDAKKVCGACHVQQECLDYALANDERFGIWGGLSERERRKLRKRAV
ncbi:WhiB family transcriptional regulator [Nesterenkonia sp. HG001]|uniref:WhiB family transcriptional regulator n=1 Tax=Nesterenkonia sp. HG001 TaxID=2983207 RepID=UPI002AC76DB6|nr:WhiB family transcriptional regulator [Nesterenkonia sp. HG001]MDZ5076959.1 WhiB family transcriptional regulator [Nesterenkonia sp. HG001]